MGIARTPINFDELVQDDRVHGRMYTDPAIFEDEGRSYLLYAVKGEAGIAIAELEGVT